MAAAQTEYKIAKSVTSKDTDAKGVPVIADVVLKAIQELASNKQPTGQDFSTAVFEALTARFPKAKMGCVVIAAPHAAFAGFSAFKCMQFDISGPKNFRIIVFSQNVQ